MAVIFVFIITALSLAVTYDWVEERGSFSRDRQPAFNAALLIKEHDKFIQANQTISSPTLIRYSARDVSPNFPANINFSLVHFLINNTGGGGGTLLASFGYFKDIENPRKYAVSAELHRLRESANAGGVRKDGADYWISFSCLDDNNCPSPQRLPAPLITALKARSSLISSDSEDILQDGTPIIFMNRP